METLSTQHLTLAGVLSELYRRHRALFAVAAANAILAVVFTLLLGVDDRMLLGRNVWTKPWKFAVSISIFSATMAWLLPQLSLGERRSRRLGTAIATAMAIEIVLITTQAARGVRSHFNLAPALDGTIAAVMGLTISLNTAVVGYVLWRVLREPPSLAPAYRHGIQLGLGLFLLASLEGGLMILHGAHSVGVAPDSAGLPLLNWHLTGGDLRVAHFIGLHGLQVLPLAGYLAARRYSGRRATGLVWLVAVVYGALTVATFVQAMFGIPFLPAVPTRTALVAVVVALVGPPVALVAVRLSD